MSVNTVTVYLTSFASRGAIVPLDACYSAHGVDPASFAPSALAQVRFGGHLYGIPEFGTVQLTMANTDLLAASGRTQALVTLQPSDLRSVADDDLLAVRRLNPPRDHARIRRA